MNIQHCNIIIWQNIPTSQEVIILGRQTVRVIQSNERWTIESPAGKEGGAKLYKFLLIELFTLRKKRGQISSVNYLKCSAGQLNLLELWKQWAWWRISKTMVGFCSVERSEVGAVHSCHHTAGAWGENPPTWSGWSRLWGKFKLNSLQTTYWSEQCTQAEGLLSLAKNIQPHIVTSINTPL